MAKVLLIETQKDSPVAQILRSLGHSIIRIHFKEGGSETFKTDELPDLVMWDAEINYSPQQYLQACFCKALWVMSNQM